MGPGKDLLGFTMIYLYRFWNMSTSSYCVLHFLEEIRCPSLCYDLVGTRAEQLLRQCEGNSEANL